MKEKEWEWGQGLEIRALEWDSEQRTPNSTHYSSRVAGESVDPEEQCLEAQFYKGSETGPTVLE